MPAFAPRKRECRPVEALVPSRVAVNVVHQAADRDERSWVGRIRWGGDLIYAAWKPVASATFIGRGQFLSTLRQANSNAPAILLALLHAVNCISFCPHDKGNPSELKDLYPRETVLLGLDLLLFEEESY